MRLKNPPMSSPTPFRGRSRGAAPLRAARRLVAGCAQDEVGDRLDEQLVPGRIVPDFVGASLIFEQHLGLGAA
jgi:hypothetical protein